VKSKYAGQYWLALPHEVAAHARKCFTEQPNGKFHSAPKSNGRRRKIWIDLDNTPHVPLFEPIIEELGRRDFDVVLTARDAFQVCDLADQKGLRYKKVGRHHGKNKIAKLVGLFYRALQLAPFVLREKPDLALSHGARSQIIICNLLRIPTVLMADYEFAQYPPLMKPAWEMVPEVIPNEALCCAVDRVRKYPGIKEDIYVNRMAVDPEFPNRLGIKPGELIITVRPPATEAHYHNPESEKLFVRFMDRACREDSVRVVLLPRNNRQGETIKSNWPHWFANSRTIIPRSAVDGLNLLWHSDLVVSGGGTMNREAAALGVPVYSIFRGKTGAIDRHLQEEGRLVMIESDAEVDQKIRVERRSRSGQSNGVQRRALAVVADHITEIALAENDHSHF
jgi:predicted glycosyltransferase